MTERTDFLYPFIDSGERDSAALLDDLARSARAKADESAGLRTRTLEASAAKLAATADDVAARIHGGGRLFFFGNGGSSTDAESMAGLFARPPSPPAIAARALVDDSAVLTALANDVGFELVFSRQLLAHSRPADVAIGLSTSGGSRNVLHALATAAARGLLTVGVAGYNGGEMARSPDIHHCLVVDHDSVHRIQESQAALGYALWSMVRSRLTVGETSAA